MYLLVRKIFALACTLLLLYTVAANSTESSEQRKENLKLYLGDMKGSYIVNFSPVVDQIIMGLSNPDPDTNITLSTSEGVKYVILKSGCRFRSCTEKSAIVYEGERVIGAALISKKCSDMRTAKRPSGCDSFSTLTIFLPQKAPNFSAVKLLLDWGNEKSPGLNVEYRAIK